MTAKKTVYTYGAAEKLYTEIVDNGNNTLAIWCYCGAIDKAGLVCIQQAPVSALEWARRAARHFVSAGYCPRFGNQSDMRLMEALAA